jgi:hypothetical protein
MTYTMQDIFIGMFHHYPDTERHFQYEHSHIVNFFRNKHEYYEVLSSFAFDSNGLTPKCAAIDSAYDGLMTAKLLLKDSHRVNPHEISSACDMAYERFVANKFTEPELVELQQLSREFRLEFRL